MESLGKQIKKDYEVSVFFPFCRIPTAGNISKYGRRFTNSGIGLRIWLWLSSIRVHCIPWRYTERRDYREIERDVKYRRLQYTTVSMFCIIDEILTHGGKELLEKCATKVRGCVHSMNVQDFSLFYSPLVCIWLTSVFNFQKLEMMRSQNCEEVQNRAFNRVVQGFDVVSRENTRQKQLFFLWPFVFKDCAS